MKVKIATEPSNTVTYITVANHLSTAISELPENKRSRNISAIAASTGDLAIYDGNGNIKTGHHTNWQDLPYESKRLVFAEQKRLGVSYQPTGGGRGSGRGGGNRNNGGGRGNGRNYSQQNRDLKSQNNKYRRQIKAMKRKPDDDDGDNSESPPADDAGNHFGGRNAKKKEKK